MGHDFEKELKKKLNRHFGLVDKETLKVLLKAPTETIVGMNAVISWGTGGSSRLIRAIWATAEYSSAVTCSELPTLSMTWYFEFSSAAPW